MLNTAATTDKSFYSPADYCQPTDFVIPLTEKQRLDQASTEAVAAFLAAGGTIQYKR